MFGMMFLVMKLKTYYIFVINDVFKNVYKANENILFNLLETMYNSKNYDLKLCASIYKQMVCLFNRSKYNSFVWNRYKDNAYYEVDDMIHRINVIGEKTSMLVYNSHIRITSNADFPIFLYDLNRLSDSIFVCDFETKDYFWVESAILNLKKEDKFSKM